MNFLSLGLGVQNRRSDSRGRQQHKRLLGLSAPETAGVLAQLRKDTKPAFSAHLWTLPPPKVPLSSPHSSSPNPHGHTHKEHTPGCTCASYCKPALLPPSWGTGRKAAWPLSRLPGIRGRFWQALVGSMSPLQCSPYLNATRGCGGHRLELQHS